MTFRAGAAVCPRCGALFEPEVLFEMRVERCAACGAAWFDAIEPPLDARIPIVHADENCPRCHKALERTDLAQGQVARCRQCGGAFVPKESFAALLSPTERVGTMPPPRDNHVRLLAVLRALTRRADPQAPPVSRS